MNPLEPLIAIAVFLFGLVFGSFLNVCIHRLPLRALDDKELGELGLERAQLSVVSPGSACPKCKAPIRFYDNIPILSWLILRGRCRHCKASISPRYLVVELLTALLFLACYKHFGPGLAALKFSVLSFLVLGLIFTDAETQLLPDSLTLPGLGLGLAFSLLVPVDALVDVLLRSFSLPVIDEIGWRLCSLVAALVGAAAGALFIYLVGAAWTWLVGEEAMGLGDVKLLAMLGAFLGVKLTVFTIFSAALLGTVIILTIVAVMGVARHSLGESYRRYRKLPFGVFLGMAALLAAFFGDALIQRYLAHLGLGS